MITGSERDMAPFFYTTVNAAVINSSSTAQEIFGADAYRVAIILSWFSGGSARVGTRAAGALAGGMVLNTTSLNIFLDFDRFGGIVQMPWYAQQHVAGAVSVSWQLVSFDFDRYNAYKRGEGSGYAPVAQPVYGVGDDYGQSAPGRQPASQNGATLSPSYQSLYDLLRSRRQSRSRSDLVPDRRALDLE